MRITHLSLKDFRSYEELDLALDPGVTTFVGRNGHGKTNIVEAVRYLSTLGSHRVSSDAPLLRAGTHQATVAAKLQRGDRSLTLEVTLNSGKQNQARLNRGAAKPRDIAGILRTVIFAPEDLDLIKGEPGGRRKFMDELVVALQPRLAGDLSDYERIIKQRSTLLKTAKHGRGDLTTLDIWDEKLATVGARIIRARLDALALLAPHVADAYRAVAPEQGVAKISYTRSIAQDPKDRSQSAKSDALANTLSVSEIFDRLTAAIHAERTKEMERGVCLVGPHRDDMTVILNSLPAKGYASHGEAWSCALALKVGSYEMLTADGGPDSSEDGEPVLILDDVFAELDAQRREALALRLAGASQVLITAAVAADVPTALQGAHITVIKEGLSSARAQHALDTTGQTHG